MSVAFGWSSAAEQYRETVLRYCSAALISPSTYADVNLHGEYLHRYFDEYWTDSDRQAFLFRVEGALAGFALVFTGEPHDIAEFL